jgi:glutamate-1-semialdehyde 2,1-aminomutase
MSSTVIEEWAAENPRSLERHRRALRVISDGVTHDVRRAIPFPLTVDRASGSRKWDADGHELICYVMGHGALLLGHGHPAVVDAIGAQAGTVLHAGAGTELEARWAEEVVRLVPSAERVRFTSSGTEATLLALHVARAWTGRTRVVKLLGHFHGWHDYAAIGSDLPFDELPPGIPPQIADLVTVIPAEVPALEEALAAGDAAALLLEPAGAWSGSVPLPEGFLEEARRLTRRHGTVLIFDEVVSGFRWAPGGVQELSGVMPDLTTLGKIVSGGLPGGALTGSADVMAVLDTPEPGSTQRVHHTGTHNAHPLAAAAGLATLRLVADGKSQKEAAGKADWVRQEFNAVLERRGVAGFAYGPESHFCLLFGVERPSVPEGKYAATLGVEVLKRGVAGRLSAALHCGMMLNGSQLFHGHGFLSAVHTDRDLEETAGAFDLTVARLQREGFL